MSIVSITIRNNSYQIACDNGQEEHLQLMASNLDKRISTLANSLGRGNDSLLLVMVALMMEDEIAELKKNLASAQVSSISPERQRSVTDAAVAQAIDTIAEYVETLAKNIEKH